MIANRVAVVVRPVGRPAPWQDVVPGTHVRPLGLSDDEALLPASRWGFQGYRLLAEYFICPGASCSWSSAGLARSVQRCEADELEIIVVLNRRESTPRAGASILAPRPLLYAGREPVPASRRPHPDRGAGRRASRRSRPDASA